MRENSPLMMLQYTIKVTWASTFVLTELNTRKHVQLCRARHVYSTAMTQHQTSVLKLCFQSQRKLNKKLPKEASWSEMSSAQMDPHDKMRSRDVSKVARGQQAPRPAHAPGTVSPPPQNEATFRAKEEKIVEERLIRRGMNCFRWLMKRDIASIGICNTIGKF